jgi:hypothetical protein
MRKHSKSWIWEVERGLRPVNILKHLEDAGLTHYLIDASGRNLPRDLIPAGEHFVVGATAMKREEINPGSGHFHLTVAGKRRNALLDGWALYAPRAKAVMKAVRKVSYAYDVDM